MRGQRPVAVRWVKFSAHNKTNTAPSDVPTSSASAPPRRDKPAPIAAGGFTLGLDPGDRSHHVCVLDAAGQIVREGALSTPGPRRFSSVK